MTYSRNSPDAALLHFPELSLQLKLHHGKIRCRASELEALQKVVVGPFPQVMVPTIAATDIDISFGITEATPASTRKSDLTLTPAMDQHPHGQTTLQVTNSNAHTFTISHGAFSKKSHPHKQTTCNQNNIVYCGFATNFR